MAGNVCLYQTEGDWSLLVLPEEAQALLVDNLEAAVSERKMD